MHPQLEQWLGYAALGAILAVPAFVLWWTLIRESSPVRRNAAALRALAQRRGLQFMDDPVLLRQYTGLDSVYPLGDSLGSGDRLHVNALSGRLHDRDTLVIFLHRTSGFGRNRRDHCHSLVAYRVGEQAPQLLLSRQYTALERKLAGLATQVVAPGSQAVLQDLESQLGRGEVEFTEHPAFTRRFRLHARDPQRVRELFAAPLRQRLMELRGQPVVTCAAGWLLVGVNRYVKPGRLDELLALAQAVLVPLTTPRTAASVS